MECISKNNSLLQTKEQNSTAQQKLFEDISLIVYGYAVPTVCIFGIVGNILNLTILTRRRLHESLKAIEQAANLCLIALAASDLAFCIFAFPTALLPPDNTYDTKKFLLYYDLYSAAIINVFIMGSTWLTVVMAIERFLAICYPLHRSYLLSSSRMKYVIVAIYISSMAFNVPVLWRYELLELKCNNQTTNKYRRSEVKIGKDSFLDDSYRILWAAIGNIVPLLLLLYLNARICRNVQKSYDLRRRFRQEKESCHESGHNITITLIVLVAMFCILVAPSEIVKHVIKLSHKESNYTYLTIEVITNFMQSVNFAANFVLYYIISPYFRNTLQHILRCMCRCQTSMVINNSIPGTFT